MMNKKAILNLLLPILFFVVICLPVFNEYTAIWEFEQKDENRNFSDSPSIDIKKLDKLPKECDTYIKDNFSFRSPLLDVFHHLKFSLMNVSPHPEKTIVGKNGWFFLAEREKEIFEGKMNFSDEELGYFATEWQRRKKYFDTRGIKFYWIIAPFKHKVYPENLPLNIYQSNSNRVSVLTEHLKPILKNEIIDPIETLLGEKDEHEVYFKGDNHWNYHAGFATAKLLLDKVKKDLPEYEIEEMPTFIWIDTTQVKGIHHRVLGLDDYFDDYQFPKIINEKSFPTKKYGFTVPEGFAYPWQFEKRFKNDKLESGLTVLFIRDSFGKQIMPFAKEFFKETVFIFDAWQYKLNEDIIEKVNPDIVVFLGLETHLEAMIDSYKEN